MNGNTFIDEVMYSVGKIQTVSTDTNFRILATSWLNRVIKDIQTRQPRWRWLEKTATFPTVVNQMSYDLPSDLQGGGDKIYDIRQKDSPVKLRYIDQGTLDLLEPDPGDSSGDPFHYTVFSDSLRLWPVPSSVMTMYIRYLKNITALADTATANEIPSQYDNVVIDGALVHAYRYEEGWGNPQTQIQLYEAGVARMIRDNAQVVGDDGVTLAHPYKRSTLKEPYTYDNTSVG